MAAIHASTIAGLGSSMLRSPAHLRAFSPRPVKMATHSSRQVLSPIRAAKLPRGIDIPKEEPKVPASFWGFTQNAEVWNSRAALIGIFGIIIVEAIMNKGLLEAIGIDVGNGLDLPL